MNKWIQMIPDLLYNESLSDLNTENQKLKFILCYII